MPVSPVPAHEKKPGGLFYSQERRGGAECVGPTDFAATLTTVSKGSGLHLLLGLLVTEVTVAMGSWK